MLKLVILNPAICCLLLAGCTSDFKKHGDVRSPEWIYSRIIGGVSPHTSPDTIEDEILKLGLSIYNDRSDFPNYDRVIMAKGSISKISNNEICIFNNQYFELSVFIKNGKIYSIDCIRDGSVSLIDPTLSFKDKESTRDNSLISVYSSNYNFNSYLSLVGNEVCPKAYNNPFSSIDDINFCKSFKKNKYPYIYSYELDIRRFKNGRATFVVFHV